MNGMLCGFGDDMCNLRLQWVGSSTEQDIFPRAVAAGLMSVEDVCEVEMEHGELISSATDMSRHLAGSGATATQDTVGDFPYVQNPMGGFAAESDVGTAYVHVRVGAGNAGNMSVGAMQTGEAPVGCMIVNDVWANCPDNPQPHIYVTKGGISYLQLHHGITEQPHGVDMQQPDLPAEVASIMNKLAAGPCMLSNDEFKVAYEHWDKITSGGNITNLLNVYMRGDGKEKSRWISLESMFVIKIIVVEWGLDFAAVVKRFIQPIWTNCMHKPSKGTKCCGASRMYGRTFCHIHKKKLEMNPLTIIKGFFAKM